MRRFRDMRCASSIAAVAALLAWTACGAVRYPCEIAGMRLDGGSAYLYVISRGEASSPVAESCASLSSGGVWAEPEQEAWGDYPYWVIRVRASGPAMFFRAWRTQP